MKKYSSILLLSFSLLSGVAMAGGTTEAGIGGALGGVLGSVVGNSIGGSTGGAIGAGLGGAAAVPWAPTSASAVRPLSAAHWAPQAATWWVARWAAPPVATLAQQPAVVPVAHWVTTWQGGRQGRLPRWPPLPSWLRRRPSPLGPWPPLRPPQAQAPLARLMPEGLAPATKAPPPCRRGFFMPVVPAPGRTGSPAAPLAASQAGHWHVR